MSDTNLEALLRPPVELSSAIIAGCASAFCLAAPEVVLMTSDAAYASAFLFGSLAVYRARQGFILKKYQRNLKRLTKFEMKSTDIPRLKNHVYLGKGFRFTQKHTQRVADTMHPRAQKYLSQSSASLKFREFEKKHPDNVIASFTKKDSWYNPFRPPPPVGGSSVLHAVETNEVDITLPHADRNQHLAIYGQTRVGKTRLGEIIVTQDIHSNRGPVIFLDPKSDYDMLARMYTEAKRAGREEDFFFFHLGFPEKSARYNAVGNFSRITEIASRIADQLPSEGNSAAFREFSWRFVNIVATALVAMGKRPDYSNILRYVTDVEPLFVKYVESWLPEHLGDDWQIKMQYYQKKAETIQKSNPRIMRCATTYAEGLRLLLEDIEFKNSVTEGLLASLRYERSFYEKIVASLLPFLQKVTTGKIAELLSPEYQNVDDDRPIFDWEQVIRKKAIVYVGLDAMASRDTSTAVGNAMLSDLLNISARIYRTGIEDGMLDGKPNAVPEIFLHADEFNEIAGDEAISMSNKAAGAGVRMVVYTQGRDDAVAKLDSQPKAAQLEQNFGNLIMLRVKTKHTAELLTDQLPEVEIAQVMSVSGASDNSDVTTSVDFTSSTQDRVTSQRVPLIQPSDIMSLPKGQAFCLFNGGELYKVRFPLPVADREMPKHLEEIEESMRRSYTTSDRWWEE